MPFRNLHIINFGKLHLCGRLSVSLTSISCQIKNTDIYMKKCTLAECMGRGTFRPSIIVYSSYNVMFMYSLSQSRPAPIQSGSVIG